MLALASRHAVPARRGATALWFSLTALLSAYVALLSWGPDIATLGGHMTYVIAQKVVSIVLVAAVTLLTHKVFE